MTIRQTNGRGRRFDSVLDTVGDTPVIRLNRIAPDHVNIFVKMEAANPAGSVKDRLALNIIEAAERDGRLKPGQTVVEATSGNTGIGLAMVCAAKGYPLVITMSEAFSVERRRLMRFFGAKVVLTPKAEKAFGMYQKAIELADKNGWFLASQFETPDNADIHENTTAREILADFEGESLDYWVTGYGTGGTVAGVSRVLRDQSPDTKIILAEPSNAALVSSGEVNPRNDAHQATEGHPAFQAHPVQGWTPDFVPFVLQEALDKGYYDSLLKIDGPDGIAWSRRLAAEEGIFVGISAGATLAAAMDVAKDAPEGSNILVMLPDTGERYLSTPLFEGVAEDMSDEERDISRSTPGQQMAE
ncbi:cysteine synthase A [Shimia thalassica]|uniref:cysteine synthase A n=1 Tax=Shimia thalassica TaxID=1715693 RepID=UPI0026E3D62D|nr:cysteine synthase A [Shimia thalassica]MDO6479652.1 cysteine synthase A [Shimia thalassica]MDO6523129.1 cysteine synthase A [Shimia thalassica]MDP2495766.1 cysteine synthase A [Shimia thalassica]MDP2519963.1 cysteine synthase A [Shimia thalassica]MDP2581064.1 cysteine synthase A [Shimia thalassica]